MTNGPTKQARQRCADLANAVDKNAVHYHHRDFASSTGTPANQAFARFVQQTSDIVRAFEARASSHGVKSLRDEDWDSLLSLILPDEVDPLVEALGAAGLVEPDGLDAPKAAMALRVFLAKQGKFIKIEEAE